MKRKLINFDVFERIQKDSLSMAETELKGAEPVLAEALGVDTLSLNCFGPQNVLYESYDGYVSANYQINNDTVIFENVEQLIIDEESETVKSKDILSKMLDAMMDENKKEEADAMFDSFMTLPSTKRMFKEARSNKKSKGINESVRRRNEMLEFAIQNGRGPVKEWSALCKNVLDYVDFKRNAPSMQATRTKQDERGNVTGVQVPTMEAANQKRLIQLKWDHMLDTDVEVKRNKAKKVSEDVEFCKAISDLKRQNALSDSEALEESLVNIVTAWPNLIYLTQPELSAQVKVALETAGARNYEDQTCDFMAEGILRTAQKHFANKVNKVVQLAGAELCEDCDQYEAFQEIASEFYPTVDANLQKEVGVYADLYDTLRKVHEASSDSLVKAETAGHLNELAAVLERKVEPDVRVVEAAANWLLYLVETNIGGGPWNVSNKPHHTVSGDHPAMAQKAKQPYAPASDFSGDWGDPAPVSDGKNYKGGLADEMRNRGAGNWADANTYPELQNPYVPKPYGDFTIRGEKGADKANDATAQWSSQDTWPALQNPYVPSSETPQSYKMNKGNEPDLVVDK